MRLPVADAVQDIEAAVNGVDPTGFQSCVDRILASRSGSIMGYGCGREGLQVKGLIMRLHHLGLRVAMQGDMAAPPLAAGDLLLVSAGPGELSTVRALMGEARKAGASTLLLTAVASAPLACLADEVLVIPATTMATDKDAKPFLPMGSIYEGALFVVFELMVLALRDALGEDAASMRARHTNME